MHQVTGLHGLSSSSIPSSPSSSPSQPIDEANDVGIDEDIDEDEEGEDVGVDETLSKLIWWNSSMDRTMDCMMVTVRVVAGRVVVMCSGLGRR